MALTAEHFSIVKQLVFNRAKIVLEPGKEYLVESRLAILAQEQGTKSVTDLIEALRFRPTKTLEASVVDAMTTNETSWYRDVKPFEALRTHVLPDLINRRKKTRSLVVWSLACSSGQEPYGVAMVMKEHFPELANWRTDIIGADISTSVLEQAKAGRYSQLEMNRGLPAGQLVRYFDREGMHYRIKPEIRQRVAFREMNLAGPWPILPRPDIVFLRNVMIYLDMDTRRAIMSNIAKNLAPDGYLFLGVGESTLNLNTSFRRVDNDRAGCFQLEDTSSIRTRVGTT
jgi:chemotaxis protein methyltransferase CheR